MNQDFTASAEDTHRRVSEASPTPTLHPDSLPHHHLHQTHLQQQTQQAPSQTFSMAPSRVPYMFSRNSPISNAPPSGCGPGGFPENTPGHCTFSLGGRRVEQQQQQSDVTQIGQLPAPFHNQQDIETEPDEVERIRNVYKNKQSLPVEENTMSYLPPHQPMFHQRHATWPSQPPFLPSPSKFLTKSAAAPPSSLFTNFPGGANMYPSALSIPQQSAAALSTYRHTHRRTPVTHTVTSSTPPNPVLFHPVNSPPPPPAATNVFSSTLEPAASASEAVGDGLRSLLQQQKKVDVSPTAVLPAALPKLYVRLPSRSPEPPIVPGGDAAVVAAAVDDIEDAEASDSSSKDNELTPEERERKLRRRQQNKEAAQRCRERKRAKAKGVFKEYQDLECSNTDLRYQIRVLQKELEQLQKTYNEHLPHCIRAPTTTS